MFKKAAGAFVLVLLIFALGLFLGLVAMRWIHPGPPQILNTATMIKQVQTLSQLVTVKYVLEKVVVLEDVKWYGENRVTLIAHGVVKAGIDMAAIQPSDIHISDKKITVTLPRPNITDVYLDDKRTEVIERTTGLVRQFDKDLEQNARRQAVDDLRRAALHGGIIQDADDRARAQLVHLFYQFGFSDVEFR